MNQTGADLEAVAKFLDASGAKLDYRRYAETLFDILVAGGMLGKHLSMALSMQEDITGDLQNGAWTRAGRYEQILIAVFFIFLLNPLHCNIAIFKNKRNAFIAEVKLSKIDYTLQLVLSYKYTCRFKIIHVTCIVQLQIFQQNVYFSQLLHSYFIKLHRFRTRRRTF